MNILKPYRKHHKAGMLIKVREYPSLLRSKRIFPCRKVVADTVGNINDTVENIIDSVGKVFDTVENNFD